MSIPGSTNGCFDHLIHLHGDTIINDRLGFMIAAPHGLNSISRLNVLF